MISIIICSKDSELLNSVSASIASTVGCEFEIVPLHNPKGEIGICEAYNIGAGRAKYDYLCFSHEDLIFHTSGWGSKLIQHLKQPETGVIGVVGCLIKPSSPSGVWLNNNNVDRHHMLQTGKNGKPFIKHWNPLDESKSEVKVLDGVFLCCRKEVWHSNRFDPITFPNFHGYDIDFSLQVSRSYKNYVVYDILIEHQSEGTNNKAWVDSVTNVATKWVQTLPTFTDQFKIDWLNDIEYNATVYFLREGLKNRTPIKKLWKHYLKLFKYKAFNFENIKILKGYYKNYLLKNK